MVSAIKRSEMGSILEVISAKKRKLKRKMRHFHLSDRILVMGLTVVLTSMTLVSVVYGMGRSTQLTKTQTSAIVNQLNAISTGMTIMDKASEATISKIELLAHPVENMIENSSIFTPAPIFTYRDDLALSRDLQKYTWDISEEYDIRYSLLLALMYRESGFVINAVGYNTDGTTDSGLMQLNDTTRPFLKKHGIVDLMDPYQNIRGGAIILRYHLDNNNQNEQCALMAYQYGQAGAQAKFNQNIWSSKAIDKLYRIEEAITAVDANN